MAEPLIEIKVQGAGVRWYERSVRRYYDKERAERDDLADEVQLNMTFTTREPDSPEGHPAVQVRARLKGQVSDAEFQYDCGVQFVLANEGAVDRESVRHFLEHSGGEYVLGYLRGAVADGTRSVGMSAIIIPFVDLDLSEDDAEVGPKT